MTRDELMDLAERILTEEDDEVLSDLMEQFDRNVPHPEGSSLFSTPKAGTPATAVWPATRRLRKKWSIPVWPTVRFACKRHRPCRKNCRFIGAKLA
ncbi:TPA: hypothetical protein ACFNMH_000026 [Neisseria elongata]